MDQSTSTSDAPKAADRANDASKPGAKPGARDMDNASKPGADRDRSAGQKNESDRSNTMTTGSTGGADVNVTSEQQTRLRTVVSRTNIREVNNVNVSVSVGTVLPASVELVALPSEIIEIVPQFRTYRVIKVGGRLLIVEPGSRRIVYIINV